MKIYVVGAGPWDFDLLTIKASQTIENSEIILATSHFKACTYLGDKNVLFLSISEIIDYIINNNHNTICVLASGDVGFYSIANTIKKQLANNSDIEFVSGISSFQYLTAKLQIPYENIKLVSLHGKTSNIIAHVSYNEYVFCLTGGENSPKSIINTLYKSGLTDVKITVGENLSCDNEKVFTANIKDLLEKDFFGLCALIINNEDFTKPHKHILDEDFIRGKTPMTKQIVRDSAVSLLDIAPTDTIYDIGAGTGSVSIAMAKKAFEGSVFAVEKKEDAVDLIHQNIKKFGTYNVFVKNGVAPQIMHDLPSPDKAFIGGSTGNLEEIIELVLCKNKDADVIVTAVTLQTLNETINVFEKFAMTPKIYNVTVAKSQKLGRYDLMTGENPVYIIRN